MQRFELSIGNTREEFEFVQVLRPRPLMTIDWDKKINMFFYWDHLIELLTGNIDAQL